MFIGLISIFVVVYLICLYMWLRVLTSRKVAIHNDGDNIIIIIGFLGLRFKLVLRWLCWYYVGCIGISSVALVFRWLRWYVVGNYPLAKCWWDIKVVEKS